MNSWTLFSWTLLHHGDFFTMTIFAPSSFFLASRPYLICCTHIEVKSLVRYFYGRLHKISHLILVKHINCHVQHENLVTFLDFRLSQGRLATYCRLGGNLCDMYIENFLTNLLVKEFWKSVHICQSYYQTSRGLVFLEYGVDIIRYVIGCNKSTSRIFTGTFVIMQINLKQFCVKLKHFYFSFIAIVTTAKIKPLCKFF